MDLTSSQLTVLKTWLDTNAVGLDDQAAADLLNQLVTPDVWAWKTSITEQQVVQGTSVDGTTFNWVGNGFITRSAGEQAAWARLFAVGVNPSLLSVRNAFSDILSGTGNAAANRTHMLATSRRKATVGENLFATGGGTTGNPKTFAAGATPGSYAEGEITSDNVSNARQIA